jgi:hypothetical protein
MWIEKSSQYIRREKLRGFVKLALFIFILSCITIPLAERIGLRNCPPTVDPKEWSEVIAEFPAIILISLVLGLFMGAIVSSRYGHYSDTLICLKCGTVIKNEGKLECNCGGKYILFEKARWKE